MTTDTPAAAPALPRLGGPAPDFEAETTQGRLALSDYRGHWVVLFSHPADFTPVCTTEFMAFAEIAPRMRDRGVEMLGLSIDSIYSHLAWAKVIEEKFGVTIPFPIIADSDRRVAMAYGMLHPDDSGTETSRCVFVIDPGGAVRAMIYYPLTTGRNVAEIERTVIALMTTDAHKVATPANWQPGDKVIVPAPRTMEDADARKSQDVEYVDWWFCRTTVPSEPG